ncbi:MAG: BamA/TamA family outer membrane protein [Roseicyclus sp.]|nr:BamA/TamA family outer membrane protein [Roseicyclus sp.]
MSAQTVADVEPVGPDGVQPINPNPIANLSARIGYNTDGGAVAGVGLTTRQLFGQDVDFSMRIEAQEGATRFNVSYSNDTLFGTSPRFGVTLAHAEMTAGDVYSFDTTTTRFQPRLTWDLSERQRLSAFLSYSRSDIQNVALTDSILIQNDAGQQQRVAVGANYAFALPLEGATTLRRARFDLGIEAGHTSRDHEFVVLTARASLTHVLRDGNIVVGSSVRLGRLATSSGTSNIGDRFMLGSNSLRGFAFGGFGPRDLAVGNQPALGGNNYGIGRLDVRFPNAFGGDSSLTPGLFVDVGSLWGLDDTNGGVAGANPVDDGAHLRSSIGLTMRIETGVGPVNLFIASPMSEQAYDETQEFGLSFSHNF